MVGEYFGAIHDFEYNIGDKLYEFAIMDYKNLDYKKAVKLLEDGNGISLRDYFKENNFLLEYGYTYLLDGNLDKAYEILSNDFIFIFRRPEIWFLASMPVS